MHGLETNPLQRCADFEKHCIIVQKYRLALKIGDSPGQVTGHAGSVLESDVARAIHNWKCKQISAMIRMKYCEGQIIYGLLRRPLHHGAAVERQKPLTCC